MDMCLWICCDLRLWRLRLIMLLITVVEVGNVDAMVVGAVVG